MGVLATFEFLAFLVIGLPAGAWVDRWRKQRVLIANDLVRAAALASLPLAWALDLLTIWQMFVVALVVGVCTVFFDVAYQSYLPELVPSDKISEGNAKLQASQSVAMVGGPGAAGHADPGDGGAPDHRPRRAELRRLGLLRQPDQARGPPTRPLPASRPGGRDQGGAVVRSETPSAACASRRAPSSATCSPR